jgi:hypothetical protein
LGVDRAAEATQVARGRVGDRGLTAVHFETAANEEIGIGEPFVAVIGRPMPPLMCAWAGV